MARPLIKICGITTPEQASQIIKLGADHIGLVFFAHSPRNIRSKQQAKEIVQAANEQGGQVVAVFKGVEISEALILCNELKLQTIQIHDDNALELAHLIPSSLQKLLAVPVAKNITKKPPKENFNLDRDFLLFDGKIPGSGQRFDKAYFTRPDARFFIAGGLNPNNISEIITHFQPNGVDVSTGVESSPGLKDIELVKRFIAEVTQHAN